MTVSRRRISSTITARRSRSGQTTTRCSNRETKASHLVRSSHLAPAARQTALIWMASTLSGLSQNHRPRGWAGSRNMGS